MEILIAMLVRGKMRYLNSSNLMKAVLLSLIVATPFLFGCEPAFRMVIDNRTTQVLFITVDGSQPKKVSPGDKLNLEGTLAISEYIIVAKNDKGETVFSKKVSTKDESLWKGEVFEIVITEQQKGAGHSDNITSPTPSRS